MLRPSYKISHPTLQCRYLMLVSPALFVSVVSNVLGKYLMAQRLMLPNAICTITAALLCPLYNWILIHK